MLCFRLRPDEAPPRTSHSSTLIAAFFLLPPWASGLISFWDRKGGLLLDSRFCGIRISKVHLFNPVSIDSLNLEMSDFRLTGCMRTGKFVLLAIMVSAGIVLQFLACSVYNNWWPMLTVLMYVLLPMPLMFFSGSDASSLTSTEGGGWADFTKFLTGASAVGSIAIPSILKHADVIGWGALAMALSSFFSFVLAIVLFLQLSNESDYSLF